MTPRPPLKPIPIDKKEEKMAPELPGPHKPKGGSKMIPIPDLGALTPDEKKEIVLMTEEKNKVGRDWVTESAILNGGADGDYPGEEMDYTEKPQPSGPVPRDVYQTDDDEVDDSPDEPCRESERCEDCKGCGSVTPIQIAREIMKMELEKDKGLHLGYVANIAMLLHDHYGITGFEERNNAANAILKLMCDVKPYPIKEI